jgi:GMP synthase-like glutamine amidotransferase
VFRFSAIQQCKIKKSVEYANNRGMACLPLNFNNMLFEKLESAGYIDMSHSDRKLWPGAAVVISSNDSAVDIFQHQEVSLGFRGFFF